MLLFFFFQAEDGIRDTSVTGVQTCALPISSMQAIEVLICIEGHAIGLKTVKGGFKAWPFVADDFPAEPSAKNRFGHFGQIADRKSVV